MEIIKQCPVCNCQDVISFPAAIAPLLQERMFKFQGPKSCKFLHCRNCDFYFFDIRPNIHEMSLLYDGYRGADYQRQRHRYEADYTEDYNAQLGKNSVERESRISNLERILSANKISPALDVLDYGGNDGCMIPPSLTGNKYCYDISGVQPVDGVRKIGDAELGAHHYDLIMLCHVLEHVSQPLNSLADVTCLMGKGCYLYIELPDDLNSQRKAIDYSRTMKGRITHIVKRLRPRWLMPHKKYSLGPLMHEHINCFTITALRELVQVAGLECVDIGSAPLNLNFGCSEIGAIYCLARKCTTQKS